MRHAPQWLQNSQYTAAADRALIGALWPGSASAGCTVTVAGGMTLNIAPGVVAVPSQNNTGSTLCKSDGVEQVVVGAAPAAGQSRIDLVVCRPRSVDLGGTAEEDFIFQVIAGVAGAPGPVPATPVGTTALYQVNVAGGVAALTAANLIDVRPWGLAVGGGPLALPPVVTAGVIQSFTAGDGEVWVAKPGVYGGAWKRATDVVIARVYRAGAWTGTPTATNQNFDRATRDLYGLYAAGLFTCPASGWYGVNYQTAANATAAGQYVQAVVRHLATTVLASNVYAQQTIYVTISTVNDRVYANKGDTLSCWVQTYTNMSGAVGSTICAASFQYLGTG